MNEPDISYPCPCGSGAATGDCCGTFLAGRSVPKTAEQLMRSRYTAYALGDGGYLYRTQHPRFRVGLTPAALRAAARGSVWQRLEVLAARGGPRDRRGQVEFRAWYTRAGQPGMLHERSRFLRTSGRWFYTQGEALGAKP